MESLKSVSLSQDESVGSGSAAKSPKTSADSSDSRKHLRQHARRLVFRNDVHRNFPSVLSRVQEIDDMLAELLRLIDEKAVLENVAVLHLKCLNYIDETDSILSTGYGKSGTEFIDSPDVISTTSSSVHVTTLLRQAAEKLESNAEGINSLSPIRNSSMKRNVTKTKSLKFIDDISSHESRFSKLWHCCRAFSIKPRKETMFEENNQGEVRDLFNTQIEFFLSCLGYIIGVGNTLRFPSMLFRYGGAFFIPYFFYLIVCGLPLVYMHMCIGQYSGLSASGAFTRMMPLASGIGWALVLLAVPVAIYYNIIVAWSLYYFWYSFVGVFADTGLPWGQCKPQWVTKFNCCELVETNLSCYENSHALTSTEAFFHYQVLNRTLLHHPTMGSIQSHLLLALAISWILVFFGVFKGLGSIGWAVTFTATIPYLLLFILLLRGISLKGASSGLEFLFKPNWASLWSLTLWKSAAEQVFYSLGIDAGPLISMASFSRYRNNIYRDAILLVVLDTFTSILCGMVIFSFIGFLATQEGKEITDILKHDSLYISFTVYPGVTSFMEWGFLWASLFFAMLTLSALDAEFAWLEMIASSIMNCLDCNEKRCEKRLLIFLCILFFLCGIPLTARGGIFIFHAIENLNANWNSFSLSLMQIIIVCYVYGVNTFLKDMGEMLRVNEVSDFDYINALQSTNSSTPMQNVNESMVSNLWPKPLIVWRQMRNFFGPTGPYIKWTWCLFSPTILTCLLVTSIFSYEPVSFNGHYLPFYYEMIAWIAMVGPLLIVPIIVVYIIFEAKRNGKPLSSIINTENWHNKKKEEEEKIPKHTKLDSDDDYWYIDPLSRGASAKSNRNFPKISITYADSDGAGNADLEDDNYSKTREKIRELEEIVSAEIASTHGMISSPGASSAEAHESQNNMVGHNVGEGDATIEVIADEESLEGVIFPSRQNNGKEGTFAMDAIQLEIKSSNNGVDNAQNESAANFSNNVIDSFNRSAMNSNREKLDNESEYDETDFGNYRRTGRIRDYEQENSATKVFKIVSASQTPHSSSTQSQQQYLTPRTQNDNRHLPKNKPIKSLQRGTPTTYQSPSFLFGPPPQLSTNTSMLSSNADRGTTQRIPVNPNVRRIKSRSDRRSDQRKNRAFRDFNLIEMIEFDRPRQRMNSGDSSENQSEASGNAVISAKIDDTAIPEISSTNNSIGEAPPQSYKFNMASNAFDIPVTVNSISSSLTDLRSSSPPPVNFSSSLRLPSVKGDTTHTKLKRPSPIFK